MKNFYISKYPRANQKIVRPSLIQETPILKYNSVERPYFLEIKRPIQKLDVKYGTLFINGLM